MATIYRCDRCKWETQLQLGVRQVSIPHLNWNKKAFASSGERNYDLCAECVWYLTTLLGSLLHVEVKEPPSPPPNTTDVAPPFPDDDIPF